MTNPTRTYLNPTPDQPKVKRKEFWAAFGEQAPPKNKGIKSRAKFRKRFAKKIPDACAKVSVRAVIVVVVIVALMASGYNPLRMIAAKMI